MDGGQSVHGSISNGIHYPQSRRTSTTIKEQAWLAPMESCNWLMHVHYCRGDRAGAMDVIARELARSGGRNEFAHSLLGTIFSEEGKLAEALEEFQTCNRLCPTSIDYIKQIAKCLFRQKRYKMALEALMEAENLSKKLDWEIHYWIAECLISLGQRDSALQWSRRAARTTRQLPPSKQLAGLLLHSGDLTGAVQVYTAALEGAPDNAEILTALGLLHARAGQQQLAVERLGSALALAPPRAAALLPLAAIMQSHCDYDVALSRYKVAAQQTPDCAALWNNIGLCFFGKQKLVAASSCLKRANALCPLSARVLHNLGLVHLASQQYASAFQFLCAALNLRPARSSTFMLMAITLNHLDDQGNALKAYEEAIQLAPEDLPVRLNYAVFLHAQRQPDTARYHLGTCEQLAQGDSSLDKEGSEPSRHVCVFFHVITPYTLHH